ncbi:uncharacterized protein LOC114870016 [Betta splendens]|uniref:Uncharacterized protein LOC114870016 n=1 Tax=Betta splendens TaxID=158456 RepID=A0A6P7PT39_BETSP|nr:uncharacterized protein LOC114870016 [Betta splendens]
MTTTMLTEFGLSLPAQWSPADTAEETDESASLVHPFPSHSLSGSKYCCCFAVLHTEAATVGCAPSQGENAGKICYLIWPGQELDGCLSIMLKSLFVYGVLGVLLIPGKCNLISVCTEDDSDLRVDCLIKATPNKINTYEFSWSSGKKMSIINTNVSGSTSEIQFKDKSYVEELEPHGYRLTLKDFTENLPHNTTYMCRILGEDAKVTVEREQLLPCSAVSLFLKSSCSWIVCLLLLFYDLHS